ncbi:hypothetical protein APHMUC_0020 [Anaplasma phagocytophilum str. ApMUC09]|uniref:Uncharacterized protein n=1 Tax=Anaplasma phagocytophilum str. ApMUC09 TaxID=1359152 RepID=A0A0F3N7Q7_ANAPH|nr:hypothetical protein APHMUC_0020 [Anaplasma phagocytophilum str. ApMUC09]SCV64401.1 hypothetical protein ANAPH2_00945 [Anaplasma phagocytophilum]
MSGIGGANALAFIFQARARLETLLSVIEFHIIVSMLPRLPTIWACHYDG